MLLLRHGWHYSVRVSLLPEISINVAVDCVFAPLLVAAFQADVPHQVSHPHFRAYNRAKHEQLPRKVRHRQNNFTGIPAPSRARRRWMASFGYAECWWFVWTVYTTVGFGDWTPVTPFGRVISVSYSGVGCAASPVHSCNAGAFDAHCSRRL
jgi:hypothetical protein